MSMATLALAEENYLHAALRALREEIATRLAVRRDRLQAKAAQRIDDWMEWIEMLEETDLANHRRATVEPDWAFAKADAENERQFRAALALGRDLLSVCDELEAAGAPVANRKDVEQQLREVEGILDWSDGYAATPAYHLICQEARADYAAGEVEEGGWEK